MADAAFRPVESFWLLAVEPRSAYRVLLTVKSRAHRRNLDIYATERRPRNTTGGRYIHHPQIHVHRMYIDRIPYCT